MFTDSPWVFLAQLAGMVATIKLCVWLRPWRLLSQFWRGSRG